VSRRSSKLDDPERTYTHDEVFVRSEMADVTTECARLKLPHAWTVDNTGKRWTLHCPAEREHDLLRALKAADV